MAELIHEDGKKQRNTEGFNEFMRYSEENSSGEDNLGVFAEILRNFLTI